MTPAALLETLETWQAAGWLRHLDVAFARFLHESDPGAPASLLLAAALVAHLEAGGHGALPLSGWPASVEALIGWPAEGLQALRRCGQEAHTGPDDAGPTPGLPPEWTASRLLAIETVPAWPPCGQPGQPGDRGDPGTSPLVASAGLLYLRRYWRHEMRIAEHIRARTGPTGGTSDHPASGPIDATRARALLDALFGPAPAEAEPDWQRVACALALRGTLTIVTGGPGTGKTHTAARMLVLLQSLHAGPQPLRVALAAPTGKAAARLRQSIHQALHHLRAHASPAAPVGAWADALPAARTLHALLGAQPGTRRFRHDAAQPLDVDLLFVDEASMVHLELMAQLLEALPASARLVLLGDKDQLASVEAGAVMGDLCQAAGLNGLGIGSAAAYGSDTAAWIREVAGQKLPASCLGRGTALAQHTVLLRRSRRFEGPIGELAAALHAGDATRALEVLQAGAGGPVTMRRVAGAAAVLPMAVDGRAGAPGGYRAYLEQVARGPQPGQTHDDWVRAALRRFEDFRVLGVVREGPWGVAGLNAGIERALADAGLISPGAPWYEGRPIMVTRNEPALGIFNGDVGVVLRGPSHDAPLRGCFLDGDQLRSVAVSRLAHVETAFAMTVHKSQGSEFAHVLLVLPDEDVPVLTRELVYTAVTRARAALTWVDKSPDALMRAVNRLTRRISGLPSRLRA